MESTALAASAAIAVVTLLATDAWEQAKTEVTALWQESHPDRAAVVEADLTAARAELMASDQGAEAQLKSYLFDEWRGRLGRLLAADPDIATRLRRLVRELGAVNAPTTAPTTARADVHIDQRAHASGQSHVVQVGRDLHIGARDRSVVVEGDVSGIVSTGDGTVNSLISGGTFQGPVIQGRDFSGLNITTSDVLPAAPEADPSSDGHTGPATRT